MKTSKISTAWRGMALACLLSLAITITFSVVLPARYRGNDSSDYIDFYQPVARSIVNGQGYMLRGSLTTLYPPGYPLLLAGLFRIADATGISEQNMVFTLSVLAMAITSAMLFWLANRVWQRSSALVSALIWATCPFALWLTKQPNTELPFMVLMLAAFIVFWRALERDSPSYRSYFAVGLLVGLSTLIRPIAIGLGVVMVLVLWLTGRGMARRVRLYSGMALLLANVVAILPWQIWLYAKTNQPILLGTASVGLLRAGLTFDANLKGYRQAIPIPADVRAFMEDALKEYPRLQTTGDVARMVIENFRKRPLTMAKFYAIKSVRSWYGTDSQQMEKPVLLAQLAYLLLVLWATKRAWGQGQRQRSLVVAVWLIVFYFWAVDTMGHPVLRYMLPAEALLFLVLASAVPSGWELRVPSFLKHSGDRVVKAAAGVQ